MSIRPRIPSTFRLTTSSPTPRPETSVTFSAVEKPGAKRSAQTSSSESPLSLSMIPLASALRTILSRSRPRPSSTIVTTTEPPEWQAERCTCPVRSFPAAARSSGNSIPWSTALRIMWTSGSPTASTMLRSISVSSPSDVNSTSLPIFCERSRERRAIFWNVDLSGTMRIAIERSCSSRTILPMWEVLRARSKCAPSRTVGSCSTIDWAITSSPTISIRRSSRSVRTRTDESTAALRSLSSFFCLRSASATSVAPTTPALTIATPSLSSPRASATAWTTCGSTFPSATRMSAIRMCGGSTSCSSAAAPAAISASGSASAASSSS